MERLAEFIGIMLGDGYFSDDRIKISFNSKDDRDYIYYVKSLIKGLFDEEAILKFRKNENTADLFLFKRKIIHSLEEIGLKKSPKWNKAIIPDMFISFDTFVLRGLFDTDGCVVMTHNNGTLYPRIEIKVCPSPMQKQVIFILKQYNFRFGVYDIGKGKVRIQINGKKQLRKWMETIGFSNSKHLEKVSNFI